MPPTLEKRVEELERKFDELARKAGSNRDWENTFGFSRDDEGFDDLTRLGREYRRTLAQNQGADS
jgi:hypothetical protein